MLLQDFDIIEWLEAHSHVIWAGILGMIALNAGLAIITLFIARRANDRQWTFFAVVFHLGLVGFVIYLLRWRKKLQSTTYAGVVLSRVSVGISIILAFILYGAFPIDVIGSVFMHPAIKTRLFHEKRRKEIEGIH
nr:hypothetical protein [Candidatus Sigynarchaeum springense]